MPLGNSSKNSFKSPFKISSKNLCCNSPSGGRKQMKMSLLISHLPIVSTPNKNVLETDGASVQLKCEVLWNFIFKKYIASF